MHAIGSSMSREKIFPDEVGKVIEDVNITDTVFVGVPSHDHESRFD